MTITVSTDGSALGNPNGPMGWAWADHASNAARTPGHQHDGDSDAGGATNGTNQIGELCAVLEALRAHRGAEPLTIETDSQYAINCSTKWVHGWKKNGWKNSQKKPVKNAPLIKAIDAEIGRREGPVRFVWVKGHNGNPGNEKVDDLAHTYSGDARSGVKDGYLPLEGWQSLLASAYAKGVDIPADAKMLIDGKITEEQYHLGRGANSGDDADDDWNDEDDYGENDGADYGADNDAGLSRSADNHDNQNDNDGRHSDDNASGNHRENGSAHRPSLAERLSEPEDVPEYDFGSRKPIVAHHRAAENDEASAGESYDDADWVSQSKDLDDSNRPGHTVAANRSDMTSRTKDSNDSNNPNDLETLVPPETAADTSAFDQYQNLDGSIEPVDSEDSTDSAHSADSEDSDESEESAGLNNAAGTAESSHSDEHRGFDNSDNTRKQDGSADSDESDESANLANSDERGDSANSNESHDGDTSTDSSRPNDSSESASSAETITSRGNATSNAGASHNPVTQPDNPATQPDKPQPRPQQPTYLPSGLTVNGTLCFSPAPCTSPTFDGKPRRIRGVIAIDGYVAGDGAITLNGAPFLIANNRRSDN